MALSGNVKGALLQLAAMGLYATHDVIIKSLGATYPALQILFFASLLSFPLVSFILMSNPQPGTLRPSNPGWVILRTICAVVSGMAGFYAFSNLPLTQVYAILFTTPLLITMLSIPLLGERVGLHRLGAVVVGLSGVLIVLRPGTQELQLGHLAAMCSAMAGAVAAIVIRRLGSRERPLVLMMWPMLGNFLATGAALTFNYKPMELHHLGMTGIIASLGLVASFLVIMAYRAGEATTVAPMQYSQILWATGYGWFLFGESVDLPTLVGASVIIASGIYIVAREGRGGVSVNRPVTSSRMRSETVTTPKSTIMQRLWPQRR